MKQNKVVSESGVFKQTIWTDSGKKKPLVIPRKVVKYLDLKSDEVLLYRANDVVLQLVRPKDVKDDTKYKKIVTRRTNGGIKYKKSNEKTYAIGVNYPDEIVRDWELEDGEKMIIVFSSTNNSIRVIPKWVYRNWETIALGKKVKKYLVQSNFTAEEGGIFIPLQ